MAVDTIISLTEKATATAFKLSEGDIISVAGANSNADSSLKYVKDNRTVITVVVDETPTAIKALASNLIDVTVTSTGNTLTINAARVKNIYTAGTGAKIAFDEEGSAWNRFAVDETPAALQTAINTAVGDVADVGTAATGVTATTYGDGRDYTTVLQFTAKSLGAPTAGANLALGALIYTFPAGAHIHVGSYMSVGLTTGGVTTDTPDVGIGSVIGSGVVAVLGGTSTFEDYITGQTAADCAGTATVKTSVATAGALTGISINEAASAKTVYLNAADGWNAAVTGNLTATGTITMKWTKMS
jgi:hypothetical protein